MSEVLSYREKPIIITDVETTGLDAQRHEIIDIGAIKVTHNLDVLDAFSMRLVPLHIENAEPKALEVNGYNPEDWMGAALPVVAAIAFQGFAKDGILSAWNVTFEFDFLASLFARVNIPSFVDRTETHRVRVIDIPSLVWMLLPRLQNIGMDQVAEYFGLPPEEKPHRGINGATRNLEVLRRLRSRTTIENLLGNMQ